MALFMNRRLVSILLFALLVFAGDRLGARLLDRVVLNSQFRFSRLYGADCNADIIVIGNSRGVAGFYAPAIEKRFGVECLNLSYNGMSPAVARAIVEDYLERHSAPKLVIVEATCVDSQEGDILNLKPFWRHSSRLSQIAKSDRYTAAATRISHLFAHNCELFFRIVHYRSKTDQTWIRRTSIDETLLHETANGPAVELEVPTEDDLKDLRAMAAACRSHNVEFRAVIAPYLPEFKEKISNWEQWKASVATAFSEDASNAFVDLSSAASDHRFFADRLHPNFSGRAAVIDAAAEKGVFDLWSQ